MKAFIFDTETTGLVKNRTIKLDDQPEVIEFYGALVDLSKKGGKILKELNYLIKPSKELSDVPNHGDKRTITQITGITNDMLKRAPHFAEVGKMIFAAIENAPVTIAHNHTFDRDMIEIEAERMKRKLKWPRAICTIEATMSMKGYRLSMTELHQNLFGEPVTGAHRAKEDVKALSRCCVELYKRGVI